MRFPPGACVLVLVLCPFVWVVDLYVLAGRVAPAFFVHKGQICLNAGADEWNALRLQAIALALLQMSLGYDGRHAREFDEACLNSLEVGKPCVPRRPHDQKRGAAVCRLHDRNGGAQRGVDFAAVGPRTNDDFEAEGLPQVIKLFVRGASISTRSLILRLCRLVLSFSR